MRITTSEKKEFFNTVRELLVEDKMYEMTDYIQHGNTSTFTHCLVVAYYSYVLALRLPLKFDTKGIVRGAMLHDFFLYDWHIPHPSHKLHGFVHPGFALKNARKYFSLNKIEEDIIEKHMWPMTLLKVPLYKESFLVSFVDKFISLSETFYLPMVPKEYKHLIITINKKKPEWG